MKAQMNAECAKNPRVPGNYEPGDGSDGHEIPELEQYLDGRPGC